MRRLANIGRGSRWSGMQSGSCHRIAVSAELLCLLKASSRKKPEGRQNVEICMLLRRGVNLKSFPEVLTSAPRYLFISARR